MSARFPTCGHTRISSSGINRAICGLQRASESREERNSSAIAIAYPQERRAGIRVFPVIAHSAGTATIRPASSSITAPPSPKRGGSMRSLWRMLALQWLGGEGSEALTDDSAVFDILMVGEHENPTRAFHVQRQSGVSHDAM